MPFLAPDTYRHKVQVLNDHCDAVGRDPATITKSVNLGLAWRQGDLEAQFGNIAEFVKPGVLMGSVQEVVDRIGEYTDAGAEWVILAMRAPFDVDGLDRFAAEVLPAPGLTWTRAPTRSPTGSAAPPDCAGSGLRGGST